jgi:hypothetical protein
VQLVELVVVGFGVVGDVVGAHEIDLCYLMPHLGRGVQVLSDQAGDPLREFLGEPGCATPTDASGEGMGAGHFGQDAEHRQQEPQLPRGAWRTSWVRTKSSILA